jgi:SAM-dependent methyltransferase
MAMSYVAEWEPEAENWVRWARTPNHDPYWYYRDAFFQEVVPPPEGTTVEIGCGEGRVARDLVARGHYVIGVDSSVTLIRHASDADQVSTYCVADGACLPLPDGIANLAVAYNSLQVVVDMGGAVREASRVLRLGGYFCACVSHPTADVGRFVTDDVDSDYVIRGDYFANRRLEDRVERGGLEMTFRGWTYSLEDYCRALEDAGLRIERLTEPRPDGAPDRYARWMRVPMFLMMKAIKL